jgi:hypothetical protein
VPQKKSLSDEEFAKIPAVQAMNVRLKLLEALAESPQPEGSEWLVVKLSEVAECFSVKMGKAHSSKATSKLIRDLFGDHVIEVHASRYYATINIDHLNNLLKQYERWRV